jgi:hypothetical protein
MPLSKNKKERATAFGRFADQATMRSNPFARYGEEVTAAGDNERPSLSAAELAAIWNDPERLREWTWGLLFAANDGDFRCYEAWARSEEDAKRRWVRHLRDDEPLRFARLISQNQCWVEPARYWADLARKRAVGRPKGQHRPGLREAWETKEFIQASWREIFGHWYRKDNMATRSPAPPTAPGGTASPSGS